VEQQINMLSRTLISRPNVEKLIRMADLDLGKQSKSEQEALIESVTKLIEIKNLGRDNLYTLSFRDSNPGKAQRVVQSLVSIFVESSLGETRKDSDTAKKFIEEQIKNYVVKLEEAEARLKDFKLKNIDLQSTDGKDMTGRLSEVSTQLNQARLELREAENARESARQQLDAERTVAVPPPAAFFKNRRSQSRRRSLMPASENKSAFLILCCSVLLSSIPTLWAPAS
jgi:polysaccharide chain length determinant protein (PEP-CTERM system associated)